MSELLQYIGSIVLLIFILLALGTGIQLCAVWGKKRKIERAFAGRESLNERAFFEKYFQSEGIPEDVVFKIRQILERNLGANLSRLTAEDDFSSNLKFFWKYDSLSDTQIVLDLEEEFRINLKPEDAAQMNTVRSIVETVWRNIQQTSA